MDVEEAVNAPRAHFSEHLLHLEDCGESPVEPMMDDEIRLWDKKSLYFGGVHAVYSADGKKYQATGDQRRQGRCPS